ncbi:sigma-70 family RNA polymerase sigma factor [Sphingomicrobium aestuariivivum]|uniref:sigma-70 family RNA polymerase sigma factor n=1 Tax=Sphingomicrobium aestuariivivum TaxID=1582356 RepID=UPI001FD6808C|nr:sigma-70 family RNA polymerase sigma factor [Sphingomicrobium aestuariivivum]MCJ8190301.1 sigma-70 family RNA polymerase sigma factor [Sphingomicrobium aestuariivivum]
MTRLGDQDMRTLMRAAQGGDKAAYRTALGALSDWLHAYFARRIAPAQVDDLVQETLVSIHVKRASYDPDRPFYPWAAAIARFRWIDALRKITRQAETELEIDPPVPSAEEPVLARLSLDQLIGHLPQKQAQPITLTKVEGRTIAETAAITGQSESAVKVNIHRGLKKLAALVESE